MNKLLLATLGAVTATAGSLVLGAGVAAADSYSVSNTGPWSMNAINSRINSNVSVRNTNNVSLASYNNQRAYSGNAYATGNTDYDHHNHPGQCTSSCTTNYHCGGNYWETVHYQMPQHHQYYYRVANHYMQMRQYMPSHYVSMPDYDTHHNYGGYGGYGGSAHTGNANNYNATHENVSIHNAAPVYTTSSGGYGGGSYISDTGPHSYNTISNHVNNHETVTNTNNVSLTSTNNQYARSGNAYVSGNTHGGSATTGDASNYNNTQATVAIHNTTPSYSTMSGGYGSGYISDTGPHSYNTMNNQANNSFRETNTNNVRLASTNNQQAYSGNAYVSGNTHGGSATTGDASNYNNTNYNVDIQNN